MHPVSPFDPGGLDMVDSFLSLASAQGIKWEHDMRHLTKERKEMVAQIERFKHSPAILCEPLARDLLMASSRAAASPGLVVAASISLVPSQCFPLLTLDLDLRF